jgi:hypothetical protein
MRVWVLEAVDPTFEDREPNLASRGFRQRGVSL